MKLSYKLEFNEIEEDRLFKNGVRTVGSPL